MLNPYDLEDFFVAENYSKINIDDLIANAIKEVKIRLIQSQIDALGMEVKLTSSKTKFNGERLWFLCPNCNRRVGVLRKHPIANIIGCRICLSLKYKSQRFKRGSGMRVFESANLE